MDSTDRARLRAALRESVEQMKAGQTVDGVEALAAQADEEEGPAASLLVPALQGSP